MRSTQIEDLLIFTKTYPVPSAKYRETTCVAAVNRDGDMRRIYPVPFRLLQGQHQFKRWEWIRATLFHANEDHRPESYKVDFDTIQRLGLHIGTQDGWKERLEWVYPHVVPGPSSLEKRRQESGETLGFVRVSRLLQLDIKPVKETEWTPEEEAKLKQDGLFDDSAVRSRPLLRKVPYDFHYVYECETPTGVETSRHKITDWEAGALYWNCFYNHGPNWEQPFRRRLETEFAKKDLIFLLGTIHRFPHQWLIVGFVYPPKSSSEVKPQLTLDLLR